MEAPSAMPPLLSPFVLWILVATRELLVELSGGIRGHTSVVPPQIACQPWPYSGHPFGAVKYTYETGEVRT